MLRKLAETKSSQTLIAAKLKRSTMAISQRARFLKISFGKKLAP
jgi:hypothetical protein